jgi:hypothetical protein
MNSFLPFRHAHRLLLILATCAAVAGRAEDAPVAKASPAPVAASPEDRLAGLKAREAK